MRTALIAALVTSGVVLTSAMSDVIDEGGRTPAGDCEGVYLYTKRVPVDFSRLGKPTDNPAIASFKGRFREECLTVNWLASIERAQPAIDADGLS